MKIYLVDGKYFRSFRGLLVYLGDKYNRPKHYNSWKGLKESLVSASMEEHERIIENYAKEKRYG